MLVNRLMWLAALVILAVLAPWRGAAAQDTGYIQVQCEPGVQIFLDGVLKGVSNRDQDGLIIEGVAVGTRIVKAVKPGFTPQEQRVSVGKGEVAVVPFQLQAVVGSVLIKSLPVECLVVIERFDGGGWGLVRRVDKTKPEARVTTLHVGTYRVTATRSKGTLTKTFDLAENDEVTVFFNFVGSSIEVTSAPGVPEDVRRAEEARMQSAARFVAAGGVLDFDDEVSMRFVQIKPGRFRMGSSSSDAGRVNHEVQHTVTISKSFWLGQTEVTQAQWQAVMGTNPSNFKGDLNLPVEQVSWNDAQEFCRRLSQRTKMVVRLPTEAEWEYACRAGTSTTYCFGDDSRRIGEYAWLDGNSGDSTQAVATKKPNAWGLYDMHGNVWEWCSDWFGNYSLGPATDPQGPRRGIHRTSRGGSWRNIPRGLRSANRGGDYPDKNFSDVGFRVVLIP